MARISKSKGLNNSEKLLARLGERNFLGLWSWPNVQFCRSGKPPKEVADLLVVCGNHVIIFSDKHIEYPDTGDESLDWKRWYRRAIKSSAKQVEKAKRYISQPNRLYLDAKGEAPLPTDLPASNEMIIHGVVVARGVAKRCIQHFNSGYGSLMICPSVKGDDHLIPGKGKADIFVIGDVNPEGPFVHVLDDGCLDIVLSELNTITDLVKYLSEKEVFIRSGILDSASGEEDLVAYYMNNMKPDGGHGFVPPDGRLFDLDHKVSIQAGVWDEYAALPERVAKLRADRASSLWDKLITDFAENILNDTTVDLGVEMDFSDHERALRYMALEPRYMRRSLGESIYNSLNSIKADERLGRTIVPAPDSRHHETAYVFFQMPYPGGDVSYDDYRKSRVMHLHAYGISAYLEHKHLRRVIGIATEPLKLLDKPGSSEDLVFFEPDGRTPELEEEAAELRKALDLLKPNRVIESRVDVDEFPKVPEPIEVNFEFPVEQNTMNRKEKRKIKARLRRQRRSR